MMMTMAFDQLNIIIQCWLFWSPYKNQQVCMAKIFSDVELPNNFAQMLLDCEIQVQLNEIVPKNIVMTIFQLYSKGIQYFESIRSYKYMYFQRKMGNLLRCPKIINSMDGNPHKEHKAHSSAKQEKLTKNEQKDQKMRVMEIKQKYQKMHQQLMGETTNLMAGDKIKKIVAENEIKFTEVKACINDQLTEQEERLKLKIQRRKFQKATKKCLSAVDLEKSTKDSLFNDSQPDRNERDNMQTDFSNVIHENQGDSGDEDIEKNTDFPVSKSQQKVSLQVPMEDKSRKKSLNLLEELDKE